ncbi:MAG: hypothetical protein ACR2RV_03280, partial [Verrucomicrobiales bacterium]
LTLGTVALAAVASHAATIVNLDPGTARFDSLVDDDSGAGGFPAGDPGGQNVDGLTFNVTFTPAAGDLDSTAAAVSLVEIGGDANGSGLYLLGGELHFISKMNGAASNLPAFDDLNWASGNNMIGARSTFGALSAGTEYSVAVVFDPLTSARLQIGVLPNGGSLMTDSFDLLNVGTKTNWSGDDSASAFRGTNIANFGGANVTGGDPFAEAAINGNTFEGDAGQALYWSQNSMIIPEPSGLAFLGLGLLLIFGSRRR